MGSELERLRTMYHQILNLTPDDLWAVDYMVCLAFINTWHQDPEPVWGYIVAPPATCKTEILRTLDGWSLAVPRDELTDNSFASGSGEEGQPDPSLLPLLDGKVLIIKDFTTILGSKPDNQIKILSVLRAAYDGTYSKTSGKVGTREYKCKFGIIAAVTPVIDAFISSNQKLGERFIILRLQRTGSGTRHTRTASLRHVRSRMIDKTQWRANLRINTQKFLNDLRQVTLRINPSSILVPDSYGEIIDNIADIVCRLRTAATSTGTTEPESGARLVQQLTNIAKARCICDSRTTLNLSDLYLARRVAQDSLTRSVSAVFRQLHHHSHPGEYVTPDQLAAWTNTALTENNGVYALMNQWSYLGIVERHSPGNCSYRLTTDTLEQIVGTDLLTTGLTPDPIPKGTPHVEPSLPSSV